MKLWHNHGPGVVVVVVCWLQLGLDYWSVVDVDVDVGVLWWWRSKGCIYTFHSIHACVSLSASSNKNYNNNNNNDHWVCSWALSISNIWARYIKHLPVCSHVSLVCREPFCPPVYLFYLTLSHFASLLGMGMGMGHVLSFYLLDGGGSWSSVGVVWVTVLVPLPSPFCDTFTPHIRIIGYPTQSRRYPQFLVHTLFDVCVA